MTRDEAEAIWKQVASKVTPETHSLKAVIVDTMLEAIRIDRAARHGEPHGEDIAEVQAGIDEAKRESKMTRNVVICVPDELADQIESLAAAGKKVVSFEFEQDIPIKLREPFAWYVPSKDTIDKRPWCVVWTKHQPLKEGEPDQDWKPLYAHPPAERQPVAWRANIEQHWVYASPDEVRCTTLNGGAVDWEPLYL